MRRAGRRDPFVRERRLVSGGVERRFLSWQPQGVPPDGRIVLLLHGHGGSADGVLGGGRIASPYRAWIPIARREGLVLLAPEGLPGVDGRRGWHDCRAEAEPSPADDLAFLTAAAAEFGGGRPDRSPRVFVVGTSNGGLMALRMAVERPSLVAGVASIVASMPAVSVCAEPSRPVPILFMNGTADPLMPFDGGTVGWGTSGRRGTVLSTERSVALWCAVNGAPEGPLVESFADLDPSDGCTVVQETYTGGAAPVRLVRVEGGGHAEPSRSARYGPMLRRVLGPQNGDIEGADVIWSFFAGLGG